MPKACSRLFCFVGPAGSGKSTLCRSLVKSFPESAVLSISTTTRKPREGEQEGVEYYFVDEAEFQRRIELGAFVEFAAFNGKYYGTERRSIEHDLDRGKDVLLDIEVQGVQQLKNIFAERLVTICVVPPSTKILEERLRARATEKEEDIRSRLEIARQEIAILQAPGFVDYLVITEEKAQAANDSAAIYRAAKLEFKYFAESKKNELFRWVE